MLENQIPSSARRRNGLFRTLVKVWGEKPDPRLALSYPTLGDIELHTTDKPVCRRAAALIIALDLTCQEIEGKIVMSEQSPHNSEFAILQRQALASFMGSAPDPQDVELDNLRKLLNEAEEAFERLAAAYLFLREGTMTSKAFDKVIPASDLDVFLGKGNWTPASAR